MTDRLLTADPLLSVSDPAHSSGLLDSSHSAAIVEALRERLVNITPAYATQPIQHGFNWAEAFTGIPPGEFFLVVFRSQHREGADRLALNEHDHHAYEAARTTPGFLHYFGGSPDADRFCLSFCLWENQAQAKIASGHDAHRSAVQLADTMYESFGLERYMVRHDSDGGLSFTPLFSTEHHA